MEDNQKTYLIYFVNKEYIQIDREILGYEYKKRKKFITVSNLQELKLEMTKLGITKENIVAISDVTNIFGE